MSLFGLNRKKEEPAAKVSNPVEDVLVMKQQGFSNNQIVQTLQRSGYQTHQIFDAMNQADLKAAGPIEGAVPPELAQQPRQNPAQPAGGPEELPLPQIEGQQPAGAPVQDRRPEMESEAGHEEQIEEIAEAIIDEKWEDLMKDIKKLFAWKDSIENRMSALEQSFKDIKENYDSLHESIVGKVAGYDKTMKEVSTDMKAMENVFQKILPKLTDNVNELSRITKGTRKKKAKK